MSKQTLAVIAAAVVLFAVGIVGALAFTGGSDDSYSHQMPDGQTMTGQMTTDQTQMTTGQTMTGMDMTP